MVDDKLIYLLTTESKEIIMSEISVNKQELKVIIHLMERAKRSFDDMLDRGYLAEGMENYDLEEYREPLPMIEQSIRRLRRLIN